MRLEGALAEGAVQDGVLAHRLHVDRAATGGGGDGGDADRTERDGGEDEAEGRAAGEGGHACCLRRAGPWFLPPRARDDEGP